ncbi:MAG: putative transport system permease protein [Mycobacteriales bacterium]
MTAVAAWLRLDLRRRWRSLAVLALLVAVASGTVLTALAGARRGATALPRLAEGTLPATAAVLPNQPGFDWSRIRALPDVETLTTFILGLEPRIEGVSGDEISFVFADTEVLNTIERPVLLAGRELDPARPDEVVVSPGFLTRHGKRLGDTLPIRLYSPATVARSADVDSDTVPADGPRITARIVGVVRSPWFSGVTSGGDDSGLIPSPGLWTRYRANMYDPDVAFANALVRLRGGEAEIPAFERRLAAVTGRSDIDVWNFADMMRRVQRSYAFQARCLLAFGLAALVASLFLVGQAVARYSAATVADLRVLTALGMAPRQAIAAAAAGPLPAAVGGVTVGAVAAGVASRWFPIGSAAGAEPAPGLRPDWPVLALGWVAVPLLVLAGGLGAAWLAFGAQRSAHSARRSSVATAAARAGLPVPVVVGSRFALEAGRGRAAVPVRPALLGAVVGTLGILGAFTFSSGVSDAANNPDRFGQTWQLEAFVGMNGQDFGPAGTVFAKLATDPDVTGLNDARIGVAHAGPRSTAVTLFSASPVDSPIRTVLTAGRMPQQPTEVTLAPGTAGAAGVRVGDRVTFNGSAGGRELTVVGLGFLATSPHNDYDSGGWVTGAGFDGLFGTSFKFHLAEIALRPGVDVPTAARRLQALAATVPGGQGLELAPAAPPTPVGELRQVRTLPVVLGVFLVLLAVGAVGHALATAVRRRRVEVAVLRALGMTRWQSRAVVITQASLLALIGLAFGVPLGLALGRLLWRVVADYTPLQYVPPAAVWALLLVGPLALLVANLLAAWPGHQAARLRIGHVLRAE